MVGDLIGLQPYSGRFYPECETEVGMPMCRFPLCWASWNCVYAYLDRARVIIGQWHDVLSRDTCFLLKFSHCREPQALIAGLDMTARQEPSSQRHMTNNQQPIPVVKNNRTTGHVATTELAPRGDPPT